MKAIIFTALVASISAVPLSFTPIAPAAEPTLSFTPIAPAAKPTLSFTPIAPAAIPTNLPTTIPANGGIIVITKTSDDWMSGTDAHVQVGLQSKSGKQDRGYTIGGDNSFERGNRDVFTLDTDLPWKDLQGICIGVLNSDGPGDAWKVDYVEVLNPSIKTGVKGYRLPVYSWLEHESEHHYPSVTCCGRTRVHQIECEPIYA